MTLDIKKDLHPVKIKTKLYGEKNNFLPRANPLEQIGQASQGNNVSSYFQIKIKEIHP